MERPVVRRATSSLPGCDKNMPGCLIAMGRLNRPALMVYGGTIQPGRTRAATTARHRLGLPVLRRVPRRQASTRRRAQDIVRHALPRRRRLRRHVHRQHDGLGDRSAGHVAALQLVDRRPRIPRSSTSAARAGAAMRKLLELDLKPRDIMTRAAFENAMVVVMALGGSTNAVLHLIAMARAVGRAADDRRLPDGQRPRAATSPTSSPAAST